MNQKYHNQERIEQDDHDILKLLIQKNAYTEPMQQD